MPTYSSRAAEEAPPPYTEFPNQTSTPQQPNKVAQPQYHYQSQSSGQFRTTPTQDTVTPETQPYSYQRSPNQYEANRSSNYNQGYSSYQPRQQTRAPPPGHPVYYPAGPHHPPPGHPPPPPPPPPRREPLCCVVL